MIKRLIPLFIFLVIIQNANSIGIETRFFQGNLTEIQKINALIDYIGKLDAVFIRNGEEHTAKKAAEHLAYKYKKAVNKITTAKEFIDFLASKSSVTGTPYQIKYKNGSVINARDVLYNQLHKLENN